MPARIERPSRRSWPSGRRFHAWLAFGLLLPLLALLGSANADSAQAPITTRPAVLLRITKPAPVAATAATPAPTAAGPTTTTTISGMPITTEEAPSSSSSSALNMESSTAATTFDEAFAAGGISASPSVSSSSSALAAISTRTASALLPDAGGTTAASVPDICIHGIRGLSSDAGDGGDGEALAAASETDVGNRLIRHEREFVQTIEGDVMLSVLTTDPSSALFVVNRINEANLIEANFEIGMRAILIDGGGESAQNLLLQEVQYQQQCISHAIGIFIDHAVYQLLAELIKDLEYNIWAIPSPRLLLFPKAAHLLQQMPWGEQIASVEILTEQAGMYDDFVEALRREQMCLMHFKSEQNIYILFGNKMSQHFDENGTIFAVPLERTDRAYIDDLPDRTFVLMEKALELRQIKDQQGTPTGGNLNSILVGQSFLPSRFLSLARPLLDLMRWLKASMEKNCHVVDDVLTMENCGNFLAFIGDWRMTGDDSEATEEESGGRRELTVAELLDVLQMRHYGTQMNFQMLQKRRQPLAAPMGGAAPTTLEVQETSALREVATQNYVTNVTTFYHYNRENRTSVELKTKFGQVFNCQYSVGDGRRYKFLYDGESVMFWRIKPEAWVATGMTAAILGLIITFAVLVFIVVRISLGDVFEGNPVTSILLLLSLVLLFASFVPFSLEYVGQQRNSHVTFDDAATLNTLCAVRVFVMTLVYCFAFSLLLCRAVMLASIGSEGGFLSHVNGYIQAVICGLSILVQLCMSIQMLVVMHVAAERVSCENLYYGHWLWAIVAYDFVLLAAIVGLVPFIYRSQRNYREGILIVIGAVLIFIIWLTWIVAAMFGDEIRDAAIPLGLQATGWAILVGVLIPRTFLIVRGIERSDIAQALPSLTSLAFAQNHNQYASDQSVYECVNPAMRQCSMEDMQQQQQNHHNHLQSPSEIPTLPLRGGGPRRQQFFANLRQANANINPQRPPPRPQRAVSPPHSLQSSLPPSPDNSKITRF